jgi:DNA-binding transcriptional LysR family regulator
MDRLDEWRTFIAVATSRSFVGAARAHGRSPQAVTRAIHALEARLATRLLHRTTRSVTLTSDGERYLEHGRRVVAEFDHLEADARTGALTGRIAITAPVLFGQLHVTPVVLAFLERHRELEARLVLLDRIASLADEGLDIGVRIGALPDSALRARRLGQVRSVVCASPAYLARAGTPRTPDALARHACIAFEGTSPVSDRWAFPRRRRAIAVHPRLITTTAQSAIAAAVAGFGITRVMSYQVAELVAAGELKIVLAGYEPPPVPVHLVQLPGISARVATAFADFAAGRLGERLAKLGQ